MKKMFIIAKDKATICHDGEEFRTDATEKFYSLRHAQDEKEDSKQDLWEEQMKFKERVNEVSKKLLLANNRRESSDKLLDNKNDTILSYESDLKSLESKLNFLKSCKVFAVMVSVTVLEEL